MAGDDPLPVLEPEIATVDALLVRVLGDGVHDVAAGSLLHAGLVVTILGVDVHIEHIDAAEDVGRVAAVGPDHHLAVTVHDDVLQLGHIVLQHPPQVPGVGDHAQSAGGPHLRQHMPERLQFVFLAPAFPDGMLQAGEALTHRNIRMIHIMQPPAGRHGSGAAEGQQVPGIRHHRRILAKHPPHREVPGSHAVRHAVVSRLVVPEVQFLAIFVGDGGIRHCGPQIAGADGLQILRQPEGPLLGAAELNHRAANGNTGSLGYRLDQKRHVAQVMEFLEPFRLPLGKTAVEGCGNIVHILLVDIFPGPVEEGVVEPVDDVNLDHGLQPEHHHVVNVLQAALPGGPVSHQLLGLGVEERLVADLVEIRQKGCGGRLR